MTGLLGACCGRAAARSCSGCEKRADRAGEKDLRNDTKGTATREASEVPPYASCCRLTSRLSCRATWRALCVCKGRDKLNGQLQPFVRRHRADVNAKKFDHAQLIPDCLWSAIFACKAIPQDFSLYCQLTAD